mmetsp:Transcript_40598/g.80216  ORF Transcript_40598/g.80216 Transcript_40598/m.80216 type:complete len:756 (-) Transcript_40598:199-2466(-)
MRAFSPGRGTFFSDDEEQHQRRTPDRPRWQDGRRASSTGTLSASSRKRNSAPVGSASSQRMSQNSRLPDPLAVTAPRRNTTPAPVMTLPGDGQAGQSKGDVAVCVRLRPGPRSETCIFKEDANHVHLMPGLADWGGRSNNEAMYHCDHAFGQEATQEEVYDQAVAPICASVLDGYNGAVIAYGQTGSGKTHTVIGTPEHAGVIPRAVEAIFASLRSKNEWSVTVSVLEIYNERARDLLSPNVAQVDIHEVVDKQGLPSFHCPDAVKIAAWRPEDALAALHEGLERRETARTDMNHSSSRSHLIFTLTIEQSDDAVKAKLRGRLHLVDLAGSERLKRSMASASFSGGVRGGGSANSRAGSPKLPSPRDGQPRDQRREAGAINKSLMHLALVIQRLTQSSGCKLRHVPYRDSMLTRLLADSFGGSSKTCLIITCSSLSQDRDETVGALEFGKRAGLVKNAAEINIEVQQEISDVVRALVAKQIAAIKRDNEYCRRRLRDAAAELVELQQQHTKEVRKLEDEKGDLERRWLQATSTAAEIQEESFADNDRLQQENAMLRQRVRSVMDELSHVQRAMAQTLAASKPIAEGCDAEGEEPVDYSQKSAERVQALRKSLILATADVTRITRLRESRLACLEREGLEFQARWSDALFDDSGNGIADETANRDAVDAAAPRSSPGNSPRSGSCSPEGPGHWSQERDPELTPDMEDGAQPALVSLSKAAREQRKKEREEEEASETELAAEVALLPYTGAGGGTAV